MGGGAARAEIHAGHVTGEALTRFDHLIRIADRLAKVKVGSDVADQTVHAALGRAGLVQAYTTSEAVARILLPPGFEWMPATYSAGWVYAPCHRSGLDTGGLSYPHHEQWCRTVPMAICGAVLRAWAMLAKG